MHKILIADDEEGVLFFFGQMLKNEGFEIITAKDGEEAKEEFQKNKPDLAILDIKMPKCDGFEVLQWIRETVNEWVPVIMLSALQDFKFIKKGYSLEADHYLTKPCSKNDLLKSVKTMLSMKGWKKEENSEGENKEKPS